MTRLASALAFLALLSACGGRQEEDQMMRRVAQAEEAANRAEAAANKAEEAARRATGGSTVSETVYEEAPEMDASYGQPSEPVPIDQQ